MPLSWNEIKDRALAFSKEWKDERREHAEAKTFWDGFFDVFGVKRRRVASFEEPVKKSDGKGGFIDLLWKGVLLVEHKSKGKDLDRAAKQAKDYFPGLKDRDLPRYVLVSDFGRFRLYDLDENKTFDFMLGEFYKNVGLFGFIAGYQTKSYGQQDPVNIRAAEKLGKLYEELEKVGYGGHKLRVLLVRLLFCLFAEDTAIFDRRRMFQDYIEQRTNEDGSDLGLHLAALFEVLDQQKHKRMKTLDEQLEEFPWVNGNLFSEMLPMAHFNAKMREALLECCSVDWSRISPAIFGSIFQSIMDKEERREIGAHYTTETNILKTLNPLFLDALHAELDHAKGSKAKLVQFLDKLTKIRVLDPACGCGNFLVIAYRELRRLELEALKALMKSDQLKLDVTVYVKVNVDQFYGIEIDEFPAQIAQVALWLTDHQENIQIGKAFGQYFVRLPLATSPTIVNANALRTDWKNVIAPAKLTYIVGNPPFVGKKERNAEQKEDMKSVFGKLKGAGLLDYVACWYMKAAQYTTKNKAIAVAFVSTSSVTQGEQVSVLWPQVLGAGMKINFAHRTFQWTSEARGKSAVHCVIIGFSYTEVTPKWLFEYDTPKSEPHARKVDSINAYLVDGPNVYLPNRSKPIGTSPKVTYGSFALDGGHYTLTPAEKDVLLADCPRAKKFVRPFWGGDELIKGKERFCLWLVDATPAEIRGLPKVRAKVEAVKNWRSGRNRETTKKHAATPALFAEIRQPKKKYLAIPTLSSENRNYIPIGFLPPEIIASNQVYVFEGATEYDFGVLTSNAHMTWVRAVCGRLESRYRYSAGIVYNNFPWPTPNAKQRATIEAKAKAVLGARKAHAKSTLEDLYDPTAMPAGLVKAHRELDRAVDAAYGIPAKQTEAERTAFLLKQYETHAAPFLAATPKKAIRTKKAVP